MANFTTNVSEKTKSKCKKLMLFGGFGFQYFYVGRIKAGIIRFIVGFLLWLFAISGIAASEISVTIFMLAILIIINLFEFINLSLGKFRDNIGNYVRQP